ncbi:MAG: hypothetical protein HY422_00415 [Candidatus Komeilibacteria bacterium]|nr:hypothetical protein [Candidatus Komeilibacteria bacterium]
MIDTRNSRLNIIFIFWFLAVALVPLIVVIPFVYATLRELALVSRAQALGTIDAREVFARFYDAQRRLTISFILAPAGALIVLYAFIRMTSKRIISPIQRTIQDLQTSAGKIQESIASTETTMHTQQTVADSLFKNYKDQLDDIKSVDREIASIVSSLADIGKQTQVAAKNVALIDQLAARSQDEAKDAGQSLSSIKRLSTSHEVLLETLAHYSAKVDSIAADVGRISVATQYLSLNASVEANKSAEHGRGLSGLVSEVGRLALTTREASMKINGLVASIQTELSRSKQSAGELRTEAESSLSVLNKALERLATMSRDARKIAESVRVIDTAVGGQSASTVEIAEHSGDLTGQAKATVRDARKIGMLAEEQAGGIRASSTVVRKLTESIAKLSELIGSRDTHAK